MIKFKDLLFVNMDLRGNDEISVVVDGAPPDRMLLKSASVIYGQYNVIWFSGTMFGISDEVEFV